MNSMSHRKTLRVALVAGAALTTAGALFGLLPPSTVHLVGTVDANQIILSAQVPGRIERLLVEEGQDVQAGDLVAVLESTELSSATESSMAQARSIASQLDAAKATAASTVGEVTHGLSSARASYEMAIASLAEAEANRKKQEDLTQRTVALAQIGALAKQDRDTAIRSLEALQAHERLSAKAVEQARAAMKAAEARDSQGKAARENVNAVSGQLSAAWAQASGAQARLGFTRIYAPVGGRISTVVNRRGEYVGAGAPIVTLVDFQQTWVHAAIPETQADWIQVSDRVVVGLSGGATVDGRVIAKAAEADFATQRDVGSQKRDIRAVRFKILIANPNGRYVPGMTAELTIRKPKQVEK